MKNVVNDLVLLMGHRMVSHASAWFPGALSHVHSGLQNNTGGAHTGS